jgi:D-2-hydroxyglutarate dehydrogenase
VLPFPISHNHNMKFKLLTSIIFNLSTGDCNLHLNVTCDSFDEKVYKTLEPFVFEYVSKLKGSVSAEHGIGFHKTKYLKYSKTAEAIELMRQMKILLDPKKILNPYKVITM